MPAKAKTLTALAVAKLTTPGAHAVGGVPGLALQVALSAKGEPMRSWLLRFTAASGKRRAFGLGSFPEVSLAKAREAALQEREAMRASKGTYNPIEAKRASRIAAREAQAKAKTFEQCAEEYIATKKKGLSLKHRTQWSATLKTYAYPIIGKLPVTDVEKFNVEKVLLPIWKTQTQTAKRLRGRIESVLDWAKSKGFRNGDNPASWKGSMQGLLEDTGEKTTVDHHAALPYAHIGEFMAALRKAEGIDARALEFTILTAVRSCETRGAEWDEIDLQAKVWTIPASRMKAGKEHQVPLSPAAIKLLAALPRTAETEFVFPGNKRGRGITESAMRNAMGRKDIKVHGFRSTFRDWSGECTSFQREVIEMCLAHAVGNAVERAYARGNLFSKRQRLMQEWATFCSKIETKTGTVISINARA